MPIISPKIPSGLEELMRGLAKSVIKENPHNIYEFAAEYFENLLKERDGSVDQSYKKFATYKVYKKSKNARLKREKENSNDVNDAHTDNGFKKDGSAVNYANLNSFGEKSIEEFILPSSTKSLKAFQKTPSISSESEIHTSIKNEPSLEAEGSPPPAASGNSEDDDIKNMVLDEDMEQAALKIQSTFRGHKTRKEIKGTKDDTTEDSVEKVEAEERKASEPEVETEEVNESDWEKVEGGHMNAQEGSADGDFQNDEIEAEVMRSELAQTEVDDDIANMVMDDEMEQAALKIQSTFRGLKARKDVKESLVMEDNENADEEDLFEAEVDAQVDECEGLKGDEGAVAVENIENLEVQPEVSKCDDLETVEADLKASKDEVEETVGIESFEVEALNVEEEDKVEIEPTEPMDNEIEELKKVSFEQSSQQEEGVEEEIVVKKTETDCENEAEREIVNEGKTEASQSDKDDEKKDEDNLTLSELEADDAVSAAIVESEAQDAVFDGEKDVEDVSAEEMQEVELVKTLSSEIEDEQIAEDLKKALEAIAVEAEAFVEDLVEKPLAESVANDVNETEQKVEESADENLPKTETEEAEDEEMVVQEVETVADPEAENVSETSLKIQLSDEKLEEIEATEAVDNNLYNEEEIAAEKAASIEIDDSEVLKKAQSFSSENAAEKSVSVDILEEQVEDERLIELADNVEGSLTEGAFNESGDEKPQDDEPIETTVEKKNVEVNEHEPQEELNKLPNESEAEALNADESDLDYADGIPVVEEVCVKKSIELLEPDQENVESETDEIALEKNSLNEIESDEAKENPNEIKGNLEKLPSVDIEYSTLKESISEHESVDEVDNKSQDITDEKSIDADSFGSKQQSLDEIHDEVMENVEPTIADDIEMKAIQKNEQLNDASQIETVESILGDNISPIELIDEVVNAYAETAATEIFSTNAEQDADLMKSIEGENVENQSMENVEPELSQDKPLQEFEQKSIDLTQENVHISQDEMEPIRDEILKPETEESEIPEEKQPSMDENMPIVAMDEKTPTVENDEQLPQDSSVDKTEPKAPEMEEDVSDMVLDEEMEDAALKIQAAFRGHKIRKEHESQQQTTESDVKAEEDVEENAETVETNIVVDQCSEDNQEVQEHEEAEQQDTSADVEDIQDSETVDQEQTEQESREEENVEEEEAAVETEENDTAEQAEDDPEAAPEETEAAEQASGNDDDDVANMVLDDEMEQAALKIQSTFRGIKSRKETKKDETEGEASTAADEAKEEKDSTEGIDEDVANMVLDDEMAQAALKIQSTFRGHKSRKDMKKDESDDGENKEEEDEEKKEEEEPKKEEEPAQSSSTEKTAKQLQDEEDIAGIVMDAEMEQTALKIQSAFRGKLRKKTPKDSDELTASSAGDQTGEETAEDDESPAKSDEDPFQQTEMSQEHESSAARSFEDEKGSETAAHYSSYDDARYSVDRHDTSYECEPSGLSSTIDDINLMQGGGIFPEPSGESSEMITGSSGEDHDPERHDKVPQDKSFETNEPIEQQNRIVSVDDDDGDDEEAIKNFDFESNKDTAEAMYYSLRKNEIETQQLSMEKQLSLKKQAIEVEEHTLSMDTSLEKMTNLENRSIEKDEDDNDVVIGAHSQPPKRLKYGMSMDDRLLGSILSQDYSTKTRKDGYPDDGFDPLLEATMRNHCFLEQLHEMSNSDEDKIMAYDDYPGDDEDQFDDFYNSNNIRQKMLASSISIADSDYFDPTNNKSAIDDDKIRTALETIHSTDSESTIASAATKIPVSDRMMGRRNNNNNITNHSMQYSSIGNAAIDKSLDEFIQSQELRIERFDEEYEGIISPPPRRQESGEDWTDDTTTYTDSDKKVGGIIEIKMEQKSFLTVDERRRTLHREDAIQRNSTREDEDSSKSSNVSAERHAEEPSSTVETVVAAVTRPQDSIVDVEVSVPVPDLTAKSKSSSQTVSQVKPHRMKRQHTMPVQIQTDVIRVIPKHLRKRIKSADSDSKKRVPK